GVLVACGQSVGNLGIRGSAKGQPFTAGAAFGGSVERSAGAGGCGPHSCEITGIPEAVLLPFVGSWPAVPIPSTPFGTECPDVGPSPDVCWTAAASTGSFCIWPGAGSSPGAPCDEAGWNFDSGER